ncbi:MAG TPA: NAD(+) synthase [Clostridiaceae bacterium]|nr:NAD(+) synthase [Clostridiaceae bacterium]
MNKDISYKELANKLENWIYNKVRKAGVKGCVVGISGGVDSAVVAALCKRAFPESTLGIHMPCYSSIQDQQDAQLIANTLNIKFKIVPLDKVFDQMKELLQNESYINTSLNSNNTSGNNASLGSDGDLTLKLALNNIKPRLRMITLYYYAQINRYLVVGTGNKSELEIGYFTKYGDGGCDILPIGNLLKSHVWELAKELGIPEVIINKAPSAGLWPGQTDEGEMGFTYKDLDNVLSGGKVSTEITYAINRLRNINSHKTKTPAIPKIKLK